MEEKKLKRRTSKSRFTRQKRTLEILIDNDESIDEIRVEFEKLEVAFNGLQDRHDEYCETIGNAEDYDKEEEYIQSCVDEFLAIKAKFKSALKKNPPATPQQEQVPGPSNQSLSASPVNPPSPMLSNPVSDPNDIQHASSQPLTVPVNHHIKLKPMVEKPKLPVFSGDVRDYLTFRDDFRHMIDPIYEERDAVSILRTSLSGRPLELLKGIGTDYAACWQYLNMYYGEARLISDAVTQDISKFRCLKEGEDSRFCEFAQLIRRCFNILKQVGKEADMNNNHMLAIIEMKLTVEDRKVYSRILQQKGEEASLVGLLSFLEVEMKTRIRATASVRSSSTQSHAKVNIGNQRFSPATNNQRSSSWKRCWGCDSIDHWPDQCTVIQGMNVTARTKKAKDVHACFSCLKKAGKDHNMRSCNRRRKCGRDNCPQYHHILLHPSNNGNVANVASEANNVTLPIIKVGLGSTDKNIAGNVMLDSGANVTLIRQAVAEELNLKGSIDIGTLGGDIQAHQTKVFKLTILANQQEHTVSAIGVPEIANVQKLNMGVLKKLERVLGCTLSRGDGPVDVLIGVDYPFMHSGETRQVDGYLARKSPLGWVTFGSSAVERGHPTVLHVNVTENTDLTKFWSTEEMGVKLSHCSCSSMSSDGLRLSPSERSQFNQIWESCEKVKDKWQIPYPWKKNPVTLIDNKILAERLLTSTENRLMKNPEHMKGYQQQMEEMLELGFSRKLSEQEIKEYCGPVCYLPHHAVIRPEKKSTPVRIVFNSSAKFHGQSLNEFWEKGPDLLCLASCLDSGNKKLP
ncbi:uncharacterized protein LOC117115613 [Anneissia japonica]|uniref:uncharacterized protein LOC117115613 n=1 Tax=Anneissia japonica TaxID=1529436 RepID=UPI0014254D22|nr:uncharacterized protein LOC117115613 [Anneissia japonica]XP_033115380.1 uncharacterized protein LOC117115613 [Anneissia japonica]